MCSDNKEGWRYGNGQARQTSYCALFGKGVENLKKYIGELDQALGVNIASVAIVMPW